MTTPQRQQPIDEREPHIETPVIQMQDLEHNPTQQSRVPNAGVKVEPKIEAEDLRDFAREDDEAIKALEELEKRIKRQAPG